MKKVFVFVLLCALFAPVRAQLQFGLSAGVNQTDMSVSASTSSAVLVPEVHAVTGWQAGVTMRYKIHQFAIQPELHYSVTGGDLQNADPGSAKLTSMVGSDVNVAYRNQSLNLPIFLQYGRNLGDLRVFLQAGPSLNYCLTGTLNGKQSLWEDVDDEWGFNRFDLGFCLGAGLEAGRFQWNLRYDLRGTEVGQKASTSRTDNINPFFDMKARSLQLTMGIFF